MKKIMLLAASGCLVLGGSSIAEAGDNTPPILYDRVCHINEKGIYQNAYTYTTSERLEHYVHAQHSDIVPPFVVAGVLVRQHWGAKGQAIFFNECTGVPL